jgi:hypothetical protein
MNIKREVLLAVFGEKAVLSMKSADISLIELYNGANRFDPVLASPWCHRVGDLWLRRVYAMVGESICTAIEPSDPLISPFFKSRV